MIKASTITVGDNSSISVFIRKQEVINTEERKIIIKSSARVYVCVCVFELPLHNYDACK